MIRPPVMLRQARASDAPALHEILTATFESTWLPNITHEAAQAYRVEDRPTGYVRERGCLFWVAEAAGEIAGLVDWDKGFINALHVHPGHARRGVGTQLMERAEYETFGEGTHVVRLETDTFNTASRTFYASRGYSEIDRYPDTEWSSGLTTILLAKSLV